MNRNFTLAIAVLFILTLISSLFYFGTKNNGVNQPELKIKNDNLNNFNPPLPPPSPLNTQNPVGNQNLNQPQNLNSSLDKPSKTYTMEEVSKHNSKESCYSVIRGKVYDLTNWIEKHPGGQEKILNICGKDGTEIFKKVHEGKQKPENALMNFEIGNLLN
jgi:cytochrome b involved in lipid metabolism